MVRGFIHGIVALIVSCFVLIPAFAASTNQPIKIGVFVDEPPIAYQTPDGQMRGIGVDIWQEIAEQNEWQFKFVPVKESIDKAIEDAKSAKFDVLIGPVSVTNQRLKVVDFSRSYYLSRIGVAVHDQAKSLWDVLQTFYSTPVLLTLLVFFVLFLIFTHLYWLFERGNNELIGRSYRWGIWHAAWETVTSFLRDVLHDPATTAGRITLAFWLVCSVIFMALFTAVITSSLTLSLFKQHSPIEKPRDLYGKTVAVQKGTQEVSIAKRLGAKLVLADNPVEELQGLNNRQYDAVIGPHEILKNEMQRHPKWNIHLTPLVLSNEAFAFLIPHRPELRREIDLALTKLQDQGRTRAICSQYDVHFVHSCDF